MKPSERDDRALDAEIDIEDDLPLGGDQEVSTAMVNMMVDLEERDDGEWLPPRLRKKIKPRKTGISVLLEGIKLKYSLVFRETKGPFPWPRHRRKVGANTTTPGTHSSHEESNKTHRVLSHHRLAPLVPITLCLDIRTPPASSIRGRLEDAIACDIRGVV